MKDFDRVASGRILAEGAQDLQIDLSNRQVEQLLAYVALLSKWNAVYNLTAIRDPAQMMVQHVLDSLAAAPAFRTAKQVLDVGAGGGLPGMVLAIWASEANPDMRVSLVDTVHKKTAFLTQAKAELELSRVSIYTARVEQLDVPHKFDRITSRAFAELADFVAWSGHLLADGGRFVAMKGQAPEQEISRLPAGWKVSEIRKIAVPGMDAQRHLIFIEKDEA